VELLLVESEEIVLVMRVFPGMSKPNPLGLLDKLDLFKACLKSLGLAVGPRAIKLEVLLDSCPQDYEIALQVLPSTIVVTTHHYDALGNVGSFEKQLEIACGFDDSTIVLLIEDDYYWTLGGFGALVELIQRTAEPCFATPYNHPDYLNLPVHQEMPGPNPAWRSGISTTCTFGARAGTIKTRIRILDQYSILNDFGMWLCITRVGLTPARVFFNRNSTQKSLGVFKDWLKAWLVFVFMGLWRVPLTPLYYPLESGATHMDSNFIGLGVRWPF
jgi:hypothetical protein